MPLLGAETHLQPRLHNPPTSSREPWPQTWMCCFTLSCKPLLRVWWSQQQKADTPSSDQTPSLGCTLRSIHEYLKQHWRWSKLGPTPTGNVFDFVFRIQTAPKYSYKDLLSCSIGSDTPILLQGSLGNMVVGFPQNTCGLSGQTPITSFATPQG